MPVPKTIADVKRMLLAGEEVTFPEVGKLKPVKRAARIGRNPATGAAVNIPAKTAIVFKQSAKFKNELATAEAAAPQL